jgi:hypothetical protein
MESKPSELITVPRSRKLARRRFPGGSDARIITIADGAPVMRRLWHEQNIQCLGITTGNPPRTRAHVAKSSTAQTPRLRPIGRQHLRTRHRQRQTAAKLMAFITGIRTIMKAPATLGHKLYACFSEYIFDQRKRVLVSCVAIDLDIRNRVSMKTGRLSQVPNRPIERSTRHPDLCACHRHESVSMSHVTVSQPCLPYRRINGGSCELQII